MRRLMTFIFGVAIGAALIFAAQRYHLVRSSDGFYLVAKTETTLSEAYVDIRQFRLTDWAEHPALATALIQAKKEHLLGEAAQSSLRDTLQGAFQSIGDRS